MANFQLLLRTIFLLIGSTSIFLLSALGAASSCGSQCGQEEAINYIKNYLTGCSEAVYLNQERIYTKGEFEHRRILVYERNGVLDFDLASSEEDPDSKEIKLTPSVTPEFQKFIHRHPNIEGLSCISIGDVTDVKLLGWTSYKMESERWWALRFSYWKEDNKEFYEKMGWKTSGEKRSGLALVSKLPAQSWRVRQIDFVKNGKWTTEYVTRHLLRIGRKLAMVEDKPYFGKRHNGNTASLSDLILPNVIGIPAISGSRLLKSCDFLVKHWGTPRNGDLYQVSCVLFPTYNSGFQQDLYVRAVVNAGWESNDVAGNAAVFDDGCKKLGLAGIPERPLSKYGLSEFGVFLFSARIGEDCDVEQ